MIKGIGIDIAEVQETRTSIEEQEGYLREVFSEEEIDACSSRPNPYECFAARFAAKEAFMKAVGTGWTSEMEYLDITVHSDGTSVPWISLSQRAILTCQRLNPFRINVSLSHTQAYACAIVVLDE